MRYDVSPEVLFNKMPLPQIIQPEKNGVNQKNAVCTKRSRFHRKKSASLIEGQSVKSEHLTDELQLRPFHNIRWCFPLLRLCCSSDDGVVWEEEAAEADDNDGGEAMAAAAEEDPERHKQDDSTDPRWRREYSNC